MPLQVGRIRRTASIAAANHRNIVGHKTHSNCWALGAAPGTTPGVPAVGLGAFYGQGLGSETLHTTSCSSGQRDVPKSLAFAALILCQTFRAATLPLNSSVIRNPKSQNTKTQFGCFWIDENSDWQVVLLGDVFGRCFL